MKKLIIILIILTRIVFLSSCKNTSNTALAKEELIKYIMAKSEEKNGQYEYHYYSDNKSGVPLNFYVFYNPKTEAVGTSLAVGYDAGLFISFIDDNTADIYFGKATNGDVIFEGSFELNSKEYTSYTNIKFDDYNGTLKQEYYNICESMINICLKTFDTKINYIIGFELKDFGFKSFKY